MNVVLYGPAGMIGSRILSELLSRGHTVTAVSRNPSHIPAHQKMTVLMGDVLSPASVAATARGADAVISAYGPGTGPNSAPPEKVIASVKSLVEALGHIGVQRLIAVGGAGSLEVAPGVQLVDTPGFPVEWRSIALAHRDALNFLRTANLDWTSVSPAALIQPGERTGQFRVGADQLLVDEKGESRISAEDFAVAMVDELEKGEHIRRRFTVAY